MAFGLAVVGIAHATPITVQELGIGANETVFINSSTLGNNLHVYAGVVDLKVNGKSMQGFCIDPFHWSSSSPLTYNLEPLAAGPKNPTGSGSTGMGIEAAFQIEQLWHQYFTPSISNINAAALQIKIWEIVDAAEPGGTFALDSIDHDSAAVTAEINSMTTFLANNPHALPANLVAVSGSGQDYVIPNVADNGSTALLLAAAMGALLCFRRRQSA